MQINGAFTQRNLIPPEIEFKPYNAYGELENKKYTKGLSGLILWS